jgi:multicomponent Na+:H+ antiporter subunit E
MRERGRAVYTKAMLSVAHFLFWIAITASVRPANLVVGAICSALTASISVHLLAGDLREGIPLRVVIRFLPFALALIWEIVRANLDVAWIIVRPSLPIDPLVIEYHTFLTGKLERSVLADVFTLTPGTVTLQLEGETLYVHCLDRRHQQRLEAGGLERLVAWLFGVKQYD